MSVSKNSLKIAAAAIGLVLAAGSAQASGTLRRSNDSCGMQFYQTNIDGTLVVKTRQTQPGRYFLRVHQQGRANLVTAELGGQFQGARGGEIELTRVAINRRDFGRFNVQTGGRAPAEVHRGAYEFEANLYVYNTLGQLTCSADYLAALGVDSLNSPNLRATNPRESYVAPRGPSYTTPAPAPRPQASQPTARQSAAFVNPRASRSGRGPN